MDYGMIGKIEKAKIYAEERDRFEFETIKVWVRGDNNDKHCVEYDNGSWHCDCSFFDTRGRCGHSMAIERLLMNMVELA